ncbi:MAG TPA: ATP-binding protein [Candidatus Limnocylindrales bacterium]|nr:ATP-binding protein [Candidatus Limnocylindrales bacterium]
MSPAVPKSRTRLILGSVLLTLLLAAVFTMGSLDVPFEPRSWRELIALFAVNCFVTAALLVFGLILIRNFVRLRMERSKAQLGVRFKTKMVLGAMAVSLAPVIFMFFVSYSLLNRTLGRWFPRPLEIASEETQKLLNDLGKGTLPRLHMLGHQAATHADDPQEPFVQQALRLGLDAVWLYDANEKLLKGGVVCDDQPEDRSVEICSVTGAEGSLQRTLPSGVEIWRARDKSYFAARVPVNLSGKPRGTLVAAYRTSPDFLTRWSTIQTQTQQYEDVKQSLRALKRQMLLILFFFTVLVLSAVTWIALFLSKQVTVPIQALAEGTREVSAGNFEYQVPEQAQDELGVLIRSFNSMTTQLRDSRVQIDEFTRNLQQAVQELERRRQLMETVLENIPAGVIYLDANGGLQRTNSALERMFQLPSPKPDSLESLVGAEANRTLDHLMRRALRMGVVAREMEIVLSDRVLHLAVTVSSLGPRRANTGYVLVFDDLTEVLRAQKSAAWQEVARRIAHEIKNPLTPIQLSAQRILRHLELRAGQGEATGDPELARISQECARLIVREVSTLSSLVNEFSQFVRFPTAKLELTDANTTVHEAVEVFSGRLDGIQLKTALEPNLPAVRADAPLLRSVIINLIDNAAEALEDATVRQITVATHLRSESDTIEIAVADTGHGISPEDKDKLFLPHFTTKDRGTGLGLAIAARIISEHGGSLRVEDNRPVGSRFLIELPVAELSAAAGSERSGADIDR